MPSGCGGRRKRRALVCGRRSTTAVLVVAALPLLVATEARTQPYRVVERRLDADQLQNARLRLEGTEIGEREGLFAGWLVGGAREHGLEPLDRELRRNGYSGIGTTSGLFGLAATMIADPLYLGLLFEGSPTGFRHPDGTTGNVGQLLFELQTGWHAYRESELSVFPFAGIAVSTVNVLVRSRSPARYPFLRDEVIEAREGFNPRLTTGSLDFGIGAQTLLPIGDGARRSGPTLGAQLGYLLPLARSNWRTEDDDDLGSDDPEASIDGAYVRLLVGYGWELRDSTQRSFSVSHCAGADCVLSCNVGFSDCDFDPRNGCETALGTLSACRACGDDCSVENGEGVCGKQGCAIAICAAGFANCNGVQSDGCESDVTRDRGNCGACGTGCDAAQSCHQGVCVGEP